MLRVIITSNFRFQCGSRERACNAAAPAQPEPSERGPRAVCFTVLICQNDQRKSSVVVVGTMVQEPAITTTHLLELEISTTRGQEYKVFTNIQTSPNVVQVCVRFCCSEFLSTGTQNRMSSSLHPRWQAFKSGLDFTWSEQKSCSSLICPHTQ